LWESGIYLKGRVIVEGEEVRLSSVARIPDGFENRVLIQDLKRPVFVGPKDILKIYGDLNPIVVGKETLVLPLNHILKPEEIEESLTNEIKKKHPNEEFKLTFLSG
ncbi:flagella basal body P-ring formation protein FlgA, partial [Leptospira interrogans serovar Pomona]|nr:flagella basal body P-ring formation protein FlgA [Leptospira interrogans serovar Pomona]